MRIEESSDGTIKVVELDPTKKHLFFVDLDTGINLQDMRFEDGIIILKRPQTNVRIVEADTLEKCDLA